MEYKILKAGSADALTIDVNKHLKEGWELLGGPQISTVTDRSDNSHHAIIQAVTKKVYTTEVRKLSGA
jgi:hypothetical protein